MISVIGLIFTFLNTLVLEDADLINLLENTAIILMLYTLFDMGAERIVMAATVADRFSASQVEKHYNLILSNVVFGSPLLVALLLAFTDKYTQLTSSVLIAFCATLLTPLKLAALKRGEDLNWLTYEFLLSSIFIFTSLALFMGTTITQANLLTSGILFLIFLYQIRHWSIRFKFSINHIITNKLLIWETFITGMLLNSFAFWDLKLDDPTHYYTVRLLAAAKLFATVYVSTVYQSGRQQQNFVLPVILVFLSMDVGLYLIGATSSFFIPSFFWLSIFLYISQIRTLQLMNHATKWNILLISTSAILFAHQFKFIEDSVLLLVLLVTCGGIYIVGNRKH